MNHHHSSSFICSSSSLFPQHTSNFCPISFFLSRTNVNSISSLHLSDTPSSQTRVKKCFGFKEMEIIVDGKMSSNKTREGSGEDNFHVVLHKVTSGDTPYVRAKHAQLVDKDLETAIVWFWKAINAGDRVDSALKDMAVAMKQMNRTEEAIEAIKSFRFRCSKHSQESLDNILIDLYKKCGKVDEQIELLKRKLRMIYQGEIFNGKPTKTARSHGKKFQVSVKQETSKLLGNLGWAYMQKSNYMAAEVVYKKAQMIDSDANKACNLGLCLIKQRRHDEARSILEDVLQGRVPGSIDPKPRRRAEELLLEIGLWTQAPAELSDLLDEDFVKGLQRLMDEWTPPPRSKRLPVFEEISSFRDQLTC